MKVTLLDKTPDGSKPLPKTGGSVTMVKDYLWTIRYIDSVDEMLSVNLTYLLVDLYSKQPHDYYSCKTGNRLSPTRLSVEIILLKALCFLTKFRDDKSTHNIISRFCQCARNMRGSDSKRFMKVYTRITLDMGARNIAWNNVNGIILYLHTLYLKDINILNVNLDRYLEINTSLNTTFGIDADSTIYAE